VGRASLAGSNVGGFGFDLGVLVHKGLAMGRWNKCGILLSSNNEDLARSLAQPVCTEEALKLWAEKIKGLMNEKIYPSFSNILLSLGLLSNNLPLAELDGKYVTGIQFKEYLLDESINTILFMLDSPKCPDSMSNDDFGHEFELGSSVINLTYHRFGRENFGLDNWINSLIPETEEMPRTIGSALHYYILQEWPTAIFTQEECIVGTAGSEKLKQNVWYIGVTDGSG